MSYKKQQPKITDTLDVFIDRVEAINDSIKKLEKLHSDFNYKRNEFINNMDNKLNQLNKIKFEVDLSNLESETKKINKELVSAFNGSSLKLKNVINDFDRSLNKISKYRFDYFLYFLAILICITICSIFFAGNQYAEKNKEKEQKEYYENFILNNKEVLELYKKNR